MDAPVQAKGLTGVGGIARVEIPISDELARKFSRDPKGSAARRAVIKFLPHELPLDYRTPMVLGYHLIMSAYGFWLPNDPRGSWSEFVGAWELLRFGRATKTQDRRSRADRRHDVALRRAAKGALKYPPVEFDGLQARAIARGFARHARSSGLTVWACAVMPDHVHLVIMRHRHAIEQVANLLKGSATKQLIDEAIHPLAEFPTRSGRCPKAFAQGQWKVFLDSPRDIRRAIAYVEANPVRDGYAPQRWSCVTPYR